MMKKFLKRRYEKMLKKNLGKVEWQSEFETLFALSIEGMNYGRYGRGDFLSINGEGYALSYAKSKFPQNTNFVLFDGGANIGEYTKTLVNIFGDSNYTIHSFEPSKKTYEILYNNLSDSKYSEGIILNNFGLSNEKSTQTLYSNKEASGMASLFQRNLAYRNIVMDKVEEVPLSTIDIYCSENNIKQIHFLKLDIEGNELNALNGAERMIKERRIQFIQFEFGGTNIDSRTYFKDFWEKLSSEYNFYRIVENGIYPITSYREIFEIFTTINFLLELK